MSGAGTYSDKTSQGPLSPGQIPFDLTLKTTNTHFGSTTDSTLSSSPCQSEATKNASRSPFLERLHLHFLGGLRKNKASQEPNNGHTMKSVVRDEPAKKEEETPRPIEGPHYSFTPDASHVHTRVWSDDEVGHLDYASEIGQARSSPGVVVQTQINTSSQEPEEGQRRSPSPKVY
jgi:hypothetical protein